MIDIINGILSDKLITFPFNFTETRESEMPLLVKIAR